MLAQNSSKPLFRIPFEKVGSYVVFVVGINNSSKLNLLLDTGLEETLITEMKSSDSILVNYYDQSIVKGLGLNNDLVAWVSRNNSLQIGKLDLRNQTLLILKNDIFNLSQQTGYPINGILGTELFLNRVVRIDYKTHKVFIYEERNFTPPQDFTRLPLHLLGKKMYVDLCIEDAKGQIRTTRMLIDTGAELTAWFRSYGENPIPIPENNIKGYIGRGLNGDIEGVFSRMSRIWLGGYLLTDAVVAHPDSASIAHALLNTQRDGTIGSQILSRFDLIFDPRNKALYIRPNSDLKKRFNYNIAGVEIYSPTEGLFIPEIFYVRKNSPAENAGILSGDLILEINNQNCFKMSLNEAKNYFEKPANHLTLKIVRNGKTLLIKIKMDQEL